ncbi:type 4a pilus biogenesis protein PilO [Lysinibacillus sp. SGAir0095]|uniref:type 4a pilus biogenesis protein PilO n=1 Tax=Lysinibacillus sp. SGAir0095 TaxID=2070463 RepID=UPI001F0D90B3|nr:type 4a pilus biogenesis protein PilO [Lysinibacillus sp. SGAir0095]
MKLSGNKNSSLLLLVALIAALLFAIYYYIVLPKKDNVEALEGSISSLQSEITALQGQITSIEEESATEVSNVFEIRQKLPKSREIDQLLLNLEEIEYVTETRITSIGFNSYDALVSESAIVPVPEEEGATDGTETQETGEVEEAEEAVQGEETGETVETPVSEIAAESIPPELKLITFNLAIEASVYENIQQFIEEIENLKRIMHIDSISYTLPGEEGEFMEEEAETLSASIQVTTFYYEGES